MHLHELDDHPAQSIGRGHIIYWNRGSVKSKMYNSAIFFGVSDMKCAIAPYFSAAFCRNNHLFTRKVSLEGFGRKSIMAQI